MSDLTEWLLACIAEDESVAEDALERGFGGWQDFADAGLNFEERTHVTRQHPAHALAVCKAHREIVERYVVAGEFAENRQAMPQARQSGKSILMIAIARKTSLEPAVLALATIYADRPGYREEWAS